MKCWKKSGPKVGCWGGKIAHVNATVFAGGVAEILDNLVLLMNSNGVRTDWRVLHRTPDYFEVTKKFHNALQGQATREK